MIGCGGGASTGPSNDPFVATEVPPEQTEEGEAASSPVGESGGSAAGDASKPSHPATEPVLAVDSAPAGLRLLTDAEQQQLKTQCAKLVQWAQQRVGKAATRVAATHKLLDVLAEAPKIEGIDVASCRDRLTGELRLYLARTKEVEATTTLKILMLAMASAVADKGKLCPSAPPVPSKLDRVKTAPYQPQASDWKAAGWTCLHHANQQPQRFQYEVNSDPTAGTFEVVARGYPVEGAEATELFLRSKVVDGNVQLHSNIYRR